MNLVGKIFVVLILVMSVLFMAFAMAVYATHRNWREVVELTPDKVVPGKEVGLKYQLEKARADNKALNDQMDSLKKQVEAELAAKIAAVTKLESELEIKKEDLKKLEARQAELEKVARENVAAMNSTQANSTDYRKELEAQRKTVEEAQKDRDANFKAVVRLTDELNQAVNEKELLKNRTDELAKDLAKADQVLRKFGLDKNKDYSSVPPTVDGLITATPSPGLVEISIGSDDGLLKGHQLEVYRIGGGQSTYVGRIEVVKTAPDRAVCKIDPKFQNSNMTKGDRVASKIE
jgi:seryl-tRNA synthetase